mmetsp:Transcript_16754/g.42370  ORF Transcript_16754/g.42370 Transcript_16754/m.42370 type:complete len:281 (+) Transcript_16754:753-1595(+)
MRRCCLHGQRQRGLLLPPPHLTLPDGPRVRARQPGEFFGGQQHGPLCARGSRRAGGQGLCLARRRRCRLPPRVHGLLFGGDARRVPRIRQPAGQPRRGGARPRVHERLLRFPRREAPLLGRDGDQHRLVVEHPRPLGPQHPRLCRSQGGGAGPAAVRRGRRPWRGRRPSQDDGPRIRVRHRRVLIGGADLRRRRLRVPAARGQRGAPRQRHVRLRRRAALGGGRVWGRVLQGAPARRCGGRLGLFRRLHVWGAAHQLPERDVRRLRVRLPPQQAPDPLVL